MISSTEEDDERLSKMLVLALRAPDDVQTLNAVYGVRRHIRGRSAEVARLRVKVTEDNGTTSGPHYPKRKFSRRAAENRIAMLQQQAADLELELKPLLRPLRAAIRAQGLGPETLDPDTERRLVEELLAGFSYNVRHITGWKTRDAAFLRKKLGVLAQKYRVSMKVEKAMNGLIFRFDR